MERLCIKMSCVADDTIWLAEQWFGMFGDQKKAEIVIRDKDLADETKEKGVWIVTEYKKVVM